MTTSSQDQQQLEFQMYNSDCPIPIRADVGYQVVQRYLLKQSREN